MNVLITGALGFTGRKLFDVLAKNESLRLFTSDRSKENSFENFAPCDLLNLENVKALLLKIKPDFIYHLAGTFSNRYDQDYAGNVVTTRNILESLEGLEKECRLMLIGSAAEYGIVSKEENPIKESRALCPASVYGLTKVYQTFLMQYYLNAFDLDIVMARPFNIFGRGVSDKLFVGRVYRQIQLLKKKQIEKIVLGNLDNERDYISIEDTVGHYMTIMFHGKKGEIYNVGSGAPVKIRTILKKILEEENIDEKFIEVARTERDNIYDVPQIYADINKLKGLGGK